MHGCVRIAKSGTGSRHQHHIRQGEVDESRERLRRCLQHHVYRASDVVPRHCWPCMCSTVQLRECQLQYWCRVRNCLKFFAIRANRACGRT